MNVVEFQEDTLNFHFLDLDVVRQISIDPSFVFQLDVGRMSANAIAVLPCPVDHYKSFFQYQCSLMDISDILPTRFSCAPEAWGDPSYSQGMVTATTSVNGKDDLLSRDYVRSVLSDITGSAQLAGLFNNTPAMLDSVKSLDAVYNDQIKHICTLLEQDHHPVDHHPVDHHPVEVLFRSLANSDIRRTSWMLTCAKQWDDYLEDYSGALFYVRHSGLYYAPLSLTPTHGWSSLVLPTRDDGERLFWWPPTSAAVPHLQTLEGLVDYDLYARPTFPIDLLQGDSIVVKLTYEPPSSTIYNKTMHSRSYLVRLVMDRPTLTLLQPGSTMVFFESDQDNIKVSDIIVLEVDCEVAVNGQPRNLVGDVPLHRLEALAPWTSVHIEFRQGYKIFSVDHV
jgi:hypothetical protein